jgi:hypothetical protein
MEEIDALNEDGLNEAKLGWSLDDWVAYYTKDGVMTLDEMGEYIIEQALRKLHAKYEVVPGNLC